jgi:predicted nucleic-acid-binding Zn-ribbon protein
MKTGRCPKCETSNVYMKHKGVMSGGGGAPVGHTFIDVSSFSSAHFDSYVCTNCGYVENYVSDTGKLGKIAEKWDKVKSVR